MLGDVSVRKVLVLPAPTHIETRPVSLILVLARKKWVSLQTMLVKQSSTISVEVSQNSKFNKHTKKITY